MQAGVVTSNLVLYLDAGDPASFTPGSPTWTDMSPAGQNFVVSTSAYNGTGPKYMDFNGSYGCAKRTSSDTTYYNSDITAIVWTRIKNSTAEWRTLFRGLSSGNDHQVIIQSGDWNIGMYDNTNGTGFNSTGYSQQSLPGYSINKWNMLTWRWNNSASPYYNFSYNDSPGTTRGSNTSSNARFKCGICSIGAYNNGNQSDPTNASQYWGDIAVVMMYNRYLSDAEVIQNYNAYALDRFNLSNSIRMGPTGIIFNDSTKQTASQVSEKGSLISITTFTSGGTYTVPSGCSTLFVKVVGGGGGAAGYCESGGAGGYAETFIKTAPAGLSAGSTISVTVGGGGGGVGYYAAAGDGGTSSFGSYVSASGGYGANRNYSHTGGHGGLGSGLINLVGGGGSGHANHHGSGGIAKGGASFFGGPSGTRHSGGEQIGPGSPGSGAPGGVTDSGNGAGHGGTSGLVVVYAYT